MKNFVNNKILKLKALMTKVQKIDYMRRLMIELINQNVDNLIQNPFGNYAIQHALEVLIIHYILK